MIVTVSSASMTWSVLVHKGCPPHHLEKRRYLVTGKVFDFLYFKIPM